MKKVILVRHGESEANLRPEIVCGRSNESPLTNIGKTQAAKAAAFLTEQEIRIDSWYTSPAVRAKDTGDLMLAAMGLQIEPFIEDALQELSQGKMEGGQRNKVYTLEVRAAIDRQLKDFCFENGESMNDVSERMNGWLQEWPKTVKDGHTSLVTTHGFSIRCLVGHLQGWGHAEIRAGDVENCSVTTLIYDQGRWAVESYAEQTLDVKPLRGFTVVPGATSNLGLQQTVAQKLG